jgi:hypothetical protein
MTLENIAEEPKMAVDRVAGAAAPLDGSDVVCKRKKSVKKFEGRLRPLSLGEPAP